MDEIPCESTPPLLSPPDIIQQLQAGASIVALALQCGLTAEGLRLRLKRWAYLYTGLPYQQLAHEVMVNRMLDYEAQLDAATDSVGVARARESLAHSRWICERRIRLFNPKAEVELENRLTIIVQRQQPVLVPVAGPGQAEEAEELDPARRRADADAGTNGAHPAAAASEAGGLSGRRGPVKGNPTGTA